MEPPSPPSPQTQAPLPPPRPDFEELFRREHALLSQKTLEGLETESPGPAGEPWIRYTPLDRVGLAFSGGGIRSATFNLGVLKALHELGVLKHVDYLSTVSGGGYIGAWWSAWRARWGKEFPEAQTTSQVGTNVTQTDMNREPEEVRHLREFSNFLSPRIGFFQSEMWNAVMAVLSAMLPAALVASSVIALALLLWLGVNSLILTSALGLPVPGHDWLTAHGLSRLTGRRLVPAALSVVTIITYICCEWTWHCAGKAEKPFSTSRMLRFHLVMLILIVAGIYEGWHLLMRASWMKFPPSNADWRWQWSTGISPQGIGFSFSPHLFDAPIIWAGVALIMLVPRLLIMRFRKVSESGKIVSVMDRALSRMLGAALVFAALAGLWLVGCWFNCTNWGTRMPAGGALLSGGTFALLRNWIGRLGPAKKGGVMDLVKPLIPQILAYAAIALWAICIAALLADWIERGVSPWLLFAILFGIVVFAVVFFDPAQVSMHSFYRNRLARAYLGASNLDAKQSSEQNRQTDVRLRDDIELRALSPTIADQKKRENDCVYSGVDSSEGNRVRPLHLVCCAANDIGGDQLGNLSRGGRSAVLSKFGFAIGNHWAEWKENVPALRAVVAHILSAPISKIKAPVPAWLTRCSKKTRKQETLMLGSAITASAAAFNSNMGSLSMTLGAGVTFLCTALNLRLGLWLPHPLTDKDGAPKLLPGLLFLKEMFGLTKSGLRPPPPDNPRRPVAQYVHLSDGAHFENLALYELVRRHCRYIIVSDCGADPQVAFDDFGNAVRRIREDFGVEIDIDLSPLTPNAARLSKQHVAVGTISYDPRGDQKDNAILVYFKPALTGDEPCDITQYRTRNEDFPHESTGDQFYDEAQWESYRRLGEHAARSALRYVERDRNSDRLSPEAIFNGARFEWYQSPERRNERILELTGRLTALEQQLRQDGPRKLVREMYPELQTMDQEETPVALMTTEEMCATLHFLIQIMQLMEDVWLGCQLDTHFTDPNNLGWMNTFQRWAYTPSFRLWWPLLKSMYGSKFRRFMEERLDLADEDYPETKGAVTLHSPGAMPQGLAQTYWARMKEKVPAGIKQVFTYDLGLTLQSEPLQTCSVQGGLAFVGLLPGPPATPRIAVWRDNEFFVPPGLWGSGIGAAFLRSLLLKLESIGVITCAVSLAGQKRTDLASRQQRSDLIAFYKREGFKLDDKDRHRLVRELK
jgi:GNAT superfamily N-acetyltransferase